MLYLREQPGADEETLSFVLVGRSAIPEGAGQILFVLFSEKSDAHPKIRVLPLDDSLESFPVGSFWFVNFIDQRLTVNFARRDGTVAAGGSVVMESLITPDGGMVPLLISNEQGERMFETRVFA